MGFTVKILNVLNVFIEINMIIFMVAMDTIFHSFCKKNIIKLIVQFYDYKYIYSVHRCLFWYQFFIIRTIKVSKTSTSLGAKQLPLL